MNATSAINYYEQYWDEKREHDKTLKELRVAKQRIADLEVDVLAYRTALREKVS